MSFGKTVTLNNGVEMPLIGLGTWQSAPGEVERAVAEALKVGYKHIDAAVIYGNQKEIATGIKQSGVNRKDIFITSKLWNNSHRPELVEADLDNTLAELETDYLDLFLIHWPVPFLPGEVLSTKQARADGKGEEVVIDTEAPSITDTWLAMVKLLKGGKVKAIGVSNFSVAHLEKLASVTEVIPAVNQIEAHPLLQQDDLIAYSAKNGIHLTAYSPLGQNITGKPPVIAHPTVKALGEKLNADPAQVLIAWGISQGYSVIPKSVTPSRIASNFKQVELSAEDVKAITDLGKGQGRVRYNTPILYEPRWDINVFEEDVEVENCSRRVW
ncbi:Aldo/keto reductase [Meredithblackwellia eburnea MCA 4105]